MNYTNVIKEFARESNISQKDARMLLGVLEEIVLKHAREEGGVKLFSSGLTIGAKYSEQRNGRNPSTGESMIIPAKYRPVARFGKAFKEAVNE